MQSFLSIFNLSQHFKKISGFGFPFSTSSPVIIKSNLLKKLDLSYFKYSLINSRGVVVAIAIEIPLFFKY